MEVKCTSRSYIQPTQLSITSIPEYTIASFIALHNITSSWQHCHNRPSPLSNLRVGVVKEHSTYPPPIDTYANTLPLQPILN